MLIVMLDATLMLGGGGGGQTQQKLTACILIMPVQTQFSASCSVAGSISRDCSWYEGQAERMHHAQAG